MSFIQTSSGIAYDVLRTVMHCIGVYANRFPVECSYFRYVLIIAQWRIQDYREGGALDQAKRATVRCFES